MPFTILRSRALPFVVAATLTAPSATAQSSGPARAAASAAAPVASGEIRGRLVESASGHPIATGSVTVRRGADGSFAGGALPNADGSFRVAGLAPGRLTLRFRAIGFTPLVREVVITADRPTADLGTIAIAAASVQLATQTVTAERADVSLAPDRNSYSTKNMATASGGTAIDVLRNVPSVEVDGSNKVSLRGNENVVVQINGRPSPLRGEQLGSFLAQLPAATVSRVEVATNPSAKDDPEGTAGIIDIVLTQQAEVGLSGGVTAGTGTTGLANASGNVGRQAGPWTVFSSYSIFHDHRPGEGSSVRENLGAATPAVVRGRFDGSQQPFFQNLTLRSEYRLSARDALSADVVVSGGRFGSDNANHYVDLDPSRAVTGRFSQFSHAVSRDATQDYTLAFRRTGDARATTFSSELRAVRNASRFENRMWGEVVQSDASTGGANPPEERDVTSGRLPALTLQSDYTHPFGAGTKVEAGVKGTTRTTSNDFGAAYRDSASGGFVPAPARASAFEYHERIGAGYAVLSQRMGSKATGQLGMRLEEAATRFDLPDTARTIRGRYGSGFPSAILSWNATALRQLKASYSRRISRPDPFQLSPIEVRRDARNVFRGNPALRPEYTDAYELGLQDGRTWGSIQLSPYLRRTAHAVRFFRSVDTSGVTVATFANVASTTTSGADLNVTYRNGGLSVFGGGGAYDYRSDAGNLPGTLSTRALSWNARANASWKFSPKTDVQLFANYRARTKTEGGAQHAFVFSNVALRRKLSGDAGSLTLRVQDPFGLSAFGFDTRDARVMESTERRFGMQGVFLTFTRNFGQQLKLRPRAPEQDQQPQMPGPGGP